MKVHIAVIAIHEEPYIYEFIEHYQKIGISKIYLYDNHPSATLSTLRRLPIIHYIHYPGAQKQLPAYHHAVTQATRENDEGIPDFLGFIDVDEFIVFENGMNTIQEFLGQEHFREYSAVAFPWKQFYSDGMINYEPRPVTERFFIGHMHKHFKSFVRPVEMIFFNNPHYFVTQNGTRNAGGSKTLADAEDPCDYVENTAVLHHYFTKSYQEFMLKLKRGSSDIVRHRPFSDFFPEHFKHL